MTPAEAAKFDAYHDARTREERIAHTIKKKITKVMRRQWKEEHPGEPVPPEYHYKPSH